MPFPAKRFLRALAWLFGAVVVVVLCFLRWGSTLLIANDPPPGHVDAAIVLQGSIAAEKARVAGAIHLLQQGVADRVLLSVPKESYWGQSIPPVARVYLERTFGRDLAGRVEFCETSGDVNSTVQEMHALTPCIEDRHWHSIVIVTSNYHTRRAGMIWRKIAARDPNIHVWIEEVADPEFQQPWWRHRQSAKILFMEFTKLVWAVFGG
jgi:DUF218 domain-containing protein